MTATIEPTSAADGTRAVARPRSVWAEAARVYWENHNVPIISAGWLAAHALAGFGAARLLFGADVLEAAFFGAMGGGAVAVFTGLLALSIAEAYSEAHKRLGLDP